MMNINKKIFIYIIGNNQAGGAQHAFLKEAQVVSNEKNKVYFISAGKTNYQTCILIKKYNLSMIESNILLNNNPISLLKYFIFLNKTIKNIKKENKYKIFCSYTTPLSSILGTICCIFNNIKERRYRVGGLLYNDNLNEYKKIFAYIIEFFLLSSNKYISFVSSSNKYSYLTSYRFLRKRAEYIDIIYSICTDNLNNEDEELKIKYKKILNLNMFDDLNKKNKFNQISLENILKDKNVVLTICNDKPSKGSKLFYKLALSNINKSIIFIHLGSRTYKSPILIKNNLLIIPHCGHNEIFKWLKICDLTVLLSTYLEGLAQVIPQSLSCSKPVIVFQNSGVKDCIIDNYNGFIYHPSTNLSEINDKLDSLFKSDNIKEIAENANKSSKFFLERHSENNFRMILNQTNFYKNTLY